MKIFVFLYFIFSNLSFAHGQSLSGKWEGWYLSSKDTVIMKINFILNDDDSTYAVYDFTKYGDYKSVCRMHYQFLGKDSIYLEETGIVRATEPSSDFTLQNMTLKISKDFKSMEGKWKDNSAKKWEGRVYFVKDGTGDADK